MRVMYRIIALHTEPHRVCTCSEVKTYHSIKKAHKDVVKFREGNCDSNKIYILEAVVLNHNAGGHIIAASTMLKDLESSV